jgi:general secretion pathway protein M
MNLNQTLAPVQTWYAGLAPRERVLVAAAAILAVVAILFSLSFRPLLAARATAAAGVAEQQSLLTDIERVARRAGPQRGGSQAAPVAAGADSLVVLVDRMTRERGLGPYLKRNQPEGTNAIRLRLENVPFDQLLEWLVDAQSRHGLGATSASFDPSGEEGRVNSNLVLSRAAG